MTNHLHIYTLGAFEMEFLAFPEELILSIAQELQSEGDLNSLAQANRRLYEVLNVHLYCSHIQRCGGIAALLHAAKRGDEDQIRFLLEKGAEVRGPQRKGKREKILETPLLLAAQNGHARIVSLLLATNQLDPDHRDSKYKLTPLSWAAAKGHVDVVKVLLEAEGVNPDSLNRIRRTPLSHAAENGHVEIVKLLLETGKVNLQSRDVIVKRTPLEWAGSPHTIDENSGSSESKSETIAPCDSKGCTRKPCLPWASGHNYEAILDLFLQHGVYLGVNRDFYGHASTVLTWAAECGFEPLVKILLRKGLPVDPYGARSPLSFAAERGDLAVVKLLLENGANPMSHNGPFGREGSPLLYAAERGHKAVAKALLERTVNRETYLNKSELAWTPLIWAVRAGQSLVTRLLIQEHARRWPGIDIGWELFYLAAWNGHEVIVKMLLDVGSIDVNACGKEGITALIAAIIERKGAVTRLWLCLGDIDVNATDKHGRTALTWASKNRIEWIIELLLQKGAETIYRDLWKEGDPYFTINVRERPPFRLRPWSKVKLSHS